MSTRRDFLMQTGMARPALAAAERRPNILLLFPDQHRYDWTGRTPQIPVRMPNLEALARRGMRFTRTLVASPVCPFAGVPRGRQGIRGEYDGCGVVNNGYDYPAGQTTYYGILLDHVTT